MISTSPSKNSDWQAVLKKNTWQFFVYKKPNLQIEANTGLGWKGGKKIYQAHDPWKGMSTNAYIR
jgi:hypothetical protein